ncbi:alginate lyase family protein [Frateuria aurantia]
MARLRFLAAISNGTQRSLSTWKQRFRFATWTTILSAVPALVSLPVSATIPCLPGPPGIDSKTLRLLETDRGRAPAPLPTIHTEGTLPHQGIHDQSTEARRDLLLMRSAALAWQVTGHDRWLQMARRYLLAWIQTYRPSLNPIDETSFDALIDTYTIIRPGLDVDEQQRTSHYLQHWAWGYVYAMRHAGRQASWSNNWQSHRIKLVTMMAVATRDSRLFGAARQLFRQQVDANVMADGEVLDFGQRDALHYVVYDLQPLLQAAYAARLKGEDWYHWRNHRGASLATAVGWLQPYASGQLSHQEFVHSRVRFDALRAQAGLHGFKGNFDPSYAAGVYWLASAWDPTLCPLAGSLQHEPPPALRAAAVPPRT